MAVLFGEAEEEGGGVVEYGTVTEMVAGQQAIGGEGFGAPVQDDALGDGGADHGGENAERAVFERGKSAADEVAIVERVHAGTDFGEVRKLRGAKGHRRRAAADAIDAEPG